MAHPPGDSHGDRLGQTGDEVRAAARFAVVTIAIGVAFVVIAALWASTCDEAATVDTAACATPQRMLLAAGAPVILCCGGIWAFVRTYRVWRNHGTWWGWQGAGWLLFAMMLVILTLSAPPIVGSTQGMSWAFPHLESPCGHDGYMVIVNTPITDARMRHTR